MTNRDAQEEATLNNYKQDRIAETTIVPPMPKQKAGYINQVLYPILDPGHGSLSLGKRSPRTINGFVFYEFHFNRLVAKSMMAEFDKLGIQYFNVIPETVIDNALGLRIGRVKALVELEMIPKGMKPVFISIHANAGPGEWTTASGIETWYQHGSSDGYDLAKIFQQEQVNALDLRNRGVKSKGGKKEFYVLRKNPVLAILLEQGFYNNRQELQLLRKKKTVEKFAIANVLAFLEANQRWWEKGSFR